MVEIIKGTTRTLAVRNDHETIEAAVMAISNASMTHDNRPLLGKGGAIPPLIGLCKQELAKKGKDKYHSKILEFSVTSLHDLSFVEENRAKMIEAGALDLLIKLLKPVVPTGLQMEAIIILSELCYVAKTGISFKSTN